MPEPARFISGEAGWGVMKKPQTLLQGPASGKVFRFFNRDPKKVMKQPQFETSGSDRNGRPLQRSQTGNLRPCRFQVIYLCPSIVIYLIRLTALSATSFRYLYSGNSTASKSNVDGVLGHGKEDSPYLLPCTKIVPLFLLNVRFPRNRKIIFHLVTLQ